MSSREGQLIALGSLFNVATLVDTLARTGQLLEDQLACMLSSLPIRNYDEILRHYRQHSQQLQPGYRVLQGALTRDFDQTDPQVLSYALMLVTLDSHLAKNKDMLALIGDRLDLVAHQAQHFGITHNNVIEGCAAIYQDTISTFRLRIQVRGDRRFLQQPQIATRIRALLLTGILAARLWHHLGGRRWQLVFARRKLLAALAPLLD